METIKLPSKFSRRKIAGIAGFLILLLSILIYYIIHHREEFVQFFMVCLANSFVVFWSALLFIVLIGFNGFQLNYLTRLFHLNLPVRVWFGLAVINNFYNLITPFKGGVIVKAVYLKQKYNFTYTNFVSVQGAFQVFALLTAGVTGFAGVWYLGGDYSKSRIILLLFFGSMVLLILILLIFSPQIVIKKKTGIGARWYGRINKIADGWHLLRQKKEKLWVISGITILQRLLKACFLILVYSCLDIEMGFWGALFISSITMFSKVIYILPGNLGLDDAITIFSANFIGIPMEGAVAAAILARMINLTVSLTLGPVFSFYLIKKKINRDEL